MLGIYSSTDSTLSGSQVDSMNDHELELIIRQVTVFYRASPRHKLKIVKVNLFESSTDVPCRRYKMWEKSSP